LYLALIATTPNKGFLHLKTSHTNTDAVHYCIIVPNRRRACLCRLCYGTCMWWWEKGEKGRQWELGKGPKSEQLTLGMGPARVEVHSYVQREELPVRVRGLSKH
jgi:hypothetical protein